jgi:mannose-6-phosphate isomerase-like protein (cupin superfamily)
MDLWINRESPADLNDSTDPVLGKPMIHEPPAEGALFRILDFAPGIADTVDEAVETHSLLKSIHVPSADDFSKLKHPSMHKTDTLNYFCLLSGELWALSEERDVLLKPGDVLVQLGCMHGWRNTGTEAARLVCVLIGANPAPGPKQ